MPLNAHLEPIINQLNAYAESIDTAIKALREFTSAAGQHNGNHRQKRRGPHWTQTPAGRRRLEEIKAERQKAGKR
jgi:hypothetical protein